MMELGDFLLQSPTIPPTSPVSVSEGSPSPTRAVGEPRVGHGGHRKDAPGASPAHRRTPLAGMVSLKDRFNLELPSFAVIDPPLGGFDRLTIRSRLKSVKGARRRGARTPQSHQPDVKDLMQMRQATEMVNNELSFQFRGAVSGWKLSPIRQEHKKRLTNGVMALRSSSMDPWMGAGRDAHGLSQRSQDSADGSVRGWSPPAPAPHVGTVDVNEFFDGVQGCTALEPAAPTGSLERVHHRIAHRRQEIGTRERLRMAAEDLPLRPPTSMLPPAEGRTSPALPSVSRPLPAMPEAGSGGGELRGFREGGGSGGGGEDFGAWGEDPQHGGAYELYLSYVRTKSVSRQRSAVSHNPSWASSTGTGRGR